jgi:hypothetical protein
MKIEYLSRSANSSSSTRINSGYRYVVSAALAIATAAACWMSFHVNTLRSANSGVIVNEKELDFGEAWESPTFPLKFTIQNPTGKDITIKQFWVSCSCISISPESVTVSAFANAQIAVALNLSGSPREITNGQEADGLSRSFNAIITPVIEEMPLQNGWQVKGKVRRVLSLSPRVLSIDDGLMYGYPFASSKIKIKAHAPVAKIVTSCPDGSGHRANPKRILPDGSDWELEVVLASNMPPGPFQSHIRLQPIDPNGNALAAVDIPVRGRIRQEVEAIPLSFEFGARHLGDNATETLALQSFQNQAFSVTKVESSTKDVKVFALTGNQPGRQVYCVNWSISNVGESREAITFTIERGNKTLSVVVKISAFGLRV